MNNEPKIYDVGNPWEKKVYRHMADYLQKKGIQKFGATSEGNQYKHWLTEDEAHHNFITPDIHKGTLARFDNHKAGDLKRILTNTAASQPFCFNLIIFLQHHSALADKLFSKLLNKQVKVIHLEPEFTPNGCNSVIGFERTRDESIGDQGNNRGTDSDIAVFYTYDNEKKGLLLIEFKFIEPEFSVCSSYVGSKKKKNETPVETKQRKIRNEERQAICSSNNFYVKMVEAKSLLCGYNKYFNWDLTSKSKVIDGEKVKSISACPFRFGLNQLWRNMILAEQVALSRNCDEYGFWVFSPSENDKYLWKDGATELYFREILTQLGNDHFKKIHLENIFDILHDIVSDEQENNWLKNMETKYRIS